MHLFPSPNPPSLPAVGFLELIHSFASLRMDIFFLWGKQWNCWVVIVTGKLPEIHFHIPTSKARAPLALHLFQHLVLSVFLNFSHFCVRVVSLCGFICISLITGDEHLFRCLLVLHISCKDFASFTHFVLSVITELLKLQLFQLEVLCWMYVWIFSHSLWLLFLFSYF